MDRRTIRTQRIAIELPRSDTPAWIMAQLQILDWDGDQVVQTRDDAERLLRRLDEVSLEVVTVFDPVVGEEITVSVAGAAEVIRAIVFGWMRAELGAELDAERGVMVLP